MILAVLFGLVALPCLGFWTLIGVGTARVLRGATGLAAVQPRHGGLPVMSLRPALREYRNKPRFP